MQPALPGVLQARFHQRALDMAVEYAKERVQFGKPIGSFQAIKHKCVDMMVQVETARSLTYYPPYVPAEH